MALLAVGELLANSDLAGSRPVTATAALAMAALVAVRRSRAQLAPVVAGAVLPLQAAAGGVAHNEVFAVIVAVLLLAYSAAAEQPRRPAMIGGAALLFGLLAAIAVDGDLSDAVLATVVMSAPWLAGRAAHRLRVLTRELAEERDRGARDAVLAERSRIARDLHDVVAHAVSVMVVQAGGARGILAASGGHPEPQRALETIEHTGRGALVEMRRLLGVLRDADADTVTPGLSRLPELIGPQVTLEVTGTPDELPSGLDVAVYRIVQESLTNARRHAPQSVAHVAIHWLADALELQIANEVAGGTGGAGHGLVGMRERVVMYGGSMHAGERNGRWVVHVRLPLSQLSAVSP